MTSSFTTFTTRVSRINTTIKGKDIWTCGSASIVNQLVKEDLIVEYHLTLIPIILGGGVRLFSYENDSKCTTTNTKAN